MKMNYALKALHVIRADAQMLRMAVKVDDPPEEILLRIQEIARVYDIERNADNAIKRAGGEG